MFDAKQKAELLRVRSGTWHEYVNENGRIKSLHFSDELRRLLGYENREDFPDSLEFYTEIVHPEERALMIEQAIAVGTGAAEVYDVEYRVRRKSGDYMLVNATGRLIRNEAGKPFLVFGSVIDISDVAESRLVKEKAESLMHSEASPAEKEQLNALYAVTRSGRWQVFYDAEGRPCNYSWNHAYRQLMGYDNDEEFHGFMSNWFDSVVPEDRERVRGYIGRVKHSDTSAGIFEADFRMYRKDRSIRWFHSTARLIFDEREQPKYALGIMNDITEKKQTELQKELFRVLSQEYRTAGLIDVVNHKMRIVRNEGGSDAARQVLGSSEGGTYEEFLHKFIERFVAPEDRLRMLRETSVEHLLAHVQEGRLYQISYSQLDAQGNRSFYQISYTRTTDENGNTAVIYGIRDIDAIMQKELRKQEKIKQQREKLAEAFEAQEAQLEEIRMLYDEVEKAREAADAANEAKTAFLFNMSHDIRTPMNAIVGFTNLIDKSLDDKEQSRDYLGKIKSANDFLLSLINNVLEMARIESGKATIDETHGNAYAFAESVCSVFEAQMKEKHLTFTHSVKVEHPDVMVDHTKLRELLLNLISNAMKYTPEGGCVSVEVVELPYEREGWTMYRTTIADTGMGMPKEFLPHLYDAFARERTAAQKGIMGTGLGMRIVKELVDLLGGSIGVTSEPGKGTTFVLELPHRIAKAPCKSVGSHEETPDYERFRGMRILLTEDNELNRELATMVLEDKGFVVETAEDGKSCMTMLETAEAGYYDFVLMDIQMPGIDGYETARRIRRMEDYTRRHVPIIAMTANAFDEDKRRALLAGMNAHVTKPLEVEQLFRTIYNVLNNKDSFVHSDAMDRFREVYEARGCRCGFFIYRASIGEEILFADAETAELFGCANVEELLQFVDGSFRNMMLAEAFAKVNKQIKQQSNAGGLDYVDYDIIRKDGQLRHIADIGCRVYDGEEDVYYVYIADVTGLRD